LKHFYDEFVYHVEHGKCMPGTGDECQK